MKPDCALFLFGDEWGEIDTNLPIIENLRKKNFNIVVMLKKDSTFKKRKKFKNLYKILKKNSNLIIYPSFFSLAKILKENFKKILHAGLREKFFFLRKMLKKEDFNISEDWIKDEIQNKYNIKYIFNTAGTIIDSCWFDFKKKINYFILPHALTFKGGRLHKYKICNIKTHDQERKKKFKLYERYPKGTIFFTLDNDEKIFFKKFLPHRFNFKLIGFKRLDKYWIKLIKKNKKKIKKNNQILVLLGKISYIGEQELKKKINEIFFIAAKYGYKIKYKFHPKSIFNIKSILKNYKNLKLSESTESAMSEAINSKITISTSKTGACLDSIAVGTPVVEYYSYSNGIKKNLQNEYLIGGKVTSLFSHYNLVKSINNYNELSAFFKKIDSSKTVIKNLHKTQFASLKKIIYKKSLINTKIVNYL